MVSSSKGKSVQCVVQSIDSIIALNLIGEVTGQQLIDMIFTQLGICEKQWFGLMYYDTKDTLRWLDMTKKVSLKEVKPFTDTSAHFKFTIKYHPESIKIELIQDVVKIIFFKHELSRLVSDCECECLPEHRILAAVAYAYLISHEHPNMTPEDVIKKKFDRLFPSHVLKQFDMTKEEWMEAVRVSTDLYKGQHFTEPLNLALEAMEQSPMYGVSYYKITNKNGTDLLLGIDCYGITIYKTNDRVNPCIVFHWQETNNVSYTGKAFHIKPVSKDDPELVIFTKSARQNDEILSLIAGSHMNYMRRRKMDEALEAEIKEAKRAQEACDMERKRFEKQREANIKYENAAQKLLQENSKDKEKKLEEEFKKTQEMMNQQIQEAKAHADQEQKNREAVEKEAEDLRKQAQALEKKIQEDKKAHEEMALLDAERLSAAEARALEVEFLTKQLKELELKHKQDMERLTALEMSGKQEKATETVTEKQLASYEDSKKAKAAEMKAHISKVGTLLKQKNVNEHSSVAKIQMNAVEGKSKFETLKALRKNNTKARVDEFESY